MSGEVVRAETEVRLCPSGRDAGRTAPGWQAQGLAAGGRRDWSVTSSVEFSFSWQPQEMLKRMVVYQTAFRHVK